MSLWDEEHRCGLSMTVLCLISLLQSGNIFRIPAPVLTKFKSAEFYLAGTSEKCGVLYATAVTMWQTYSSELQMDARSFRILQGCFEWVQQSLLLRALRCVELNGQPFDHLLQNMIVVTFHAECTQEK
jgi:hypothetical protein